MSTPPLPDWIRSPQVPGYTAAHALCPGEPRLFGTESLFGNWNGEVLLLAKVFGPTRYVRDLLRDGDPRPYRHDPDRPANLRLEELVAPIRRHGLLYGSALANLLRDDDRWSGTLRHRTEALAYGNRVLRFVLAQMPQLRVIVCMGREAWECATRATGVKGDWKDHWEREEPLGRLVATCNPAARVSKEKRVLGWSLVQAMLEAPSAVGS